MKLFVDDIRACPEGWTPARTITEAIRLLATVPVEEISLDHDISTDCCHLASMETFEAVARYIAIMPANSRPKVLIHTGNFPAGDKMVEILGIDTWVPWDPLEEPIK